MAQKRFDPELVRRAQEGDRRARDLLLRRLESVIRSFFGQRTGYAATVDDMVQNTLLRVHNGLEVLKDPARFQAFAMKAALYELQDYYRGRYSPKETPYSSEVLSQASTGESGYAGSAIDAQRALAALTPHARRILELREYGYRYKEIAQTLGTTEQAVKMQVKRAFTKMRATLTEES